jgi:hypothetical protein
MKKLLLQKKPMVRAPKNYKDIITKSAGKSRLSIFFAVVGIATLTGIGYAFIPTGEIDYSAPPSASAQAVESTDQPPTDTAGESTTASTTSTTPSIVPTHITTPTPVKAIYLTSWAAGTHSFRAHIENIADTTEVNAVVIDVKDYTGKISYKVDTPELVKVGSSENRIPDVVSFIDTLHKKGIYVIARVAVFQDPYYIKVRPDLAVRTNTDKTKAWKDRKGISWLDAGSEDVWKYVQMIAEESYRKGFDEINFDYIRFPSDGNMKDIYYPMSEGKKKSDVMNSFFTYIGKTLRDEGIPTSADLFGMTTTNKDDLNIGQLLEDALRNFDFVAPMVYPSHYPPTWNGFKNPADHPYDVVNISMKKAVARAEAIPVSRLKLRPWLQDFDLGAKYTKEMVRAQMTATYDVGLDSWMLWDAANKYTPEALLSDADAQALAKKYEEKNTTQSTNGDTSIDQKNNNVQ